MANYRLPLDADGVKYHGREYDDKGGIIAAGVDEHGNDKPILINTDGSLNMQSVVQELHDIKQRQQEILERLDDPIDTRLTGSNVELLVAELDSDTLTVPAGVTKRITGKIDVSDYRYLIVQFLPWAQGKDMDYSVYVYYHKADSEITMQRLNVIKSKSTSNQVSNRVDVNFIGIEIRIENRSEEDHTFGELYLIGVRR